MNQRAERPLVATLLASLLVATGLAACGGSDPSAAGGSDEPEATSTSAVTAATVKLAFTPSSKSFGSVKVGATSSSTTFTLKNGGTSTTGAIAIGLAGSDPSEFEITSDKCAGTKLAAGASCTVAVEFAPTATGAQSASLTATPSGGSAASATLTGSGTKPATLAISPKSASFGSIGEGTTGAAVPFTVTNTGTSSSGALSVSLIGTNPGDFVIAKDGCAAVALAGGQSCTVDVAFAPPAGALGTASATLAVTGSPGGSVDATLVGTAVLPAELSITAPGGAFGGVPVGSTSAVETFTLTNVGGASAGVPTLGVSSPAFAIVSNGCAGILAPGGSCAFGVVFHPTSVGATSASLTASASPGGATSYVLTGTGLPTSVTVTVQQALDPNCAPSTYGVISFSNGATCALYGGDTQACTVTLPYDQLVTASVSMDYGRIESFSGACYSAGTSCSFEATSNETLVLTYCGVIE